jgi:endonuclease/exonuclease/phosphatase family metal-dependent hydrolase
VSVLVTHLSPNEIDRAVQTAALMRHAQTQATPLMVLGDLNGTIEDPTLEPLQQWLVNAAGADPHPTYPASRPEVALDHIYVSSEIKIETPAMPVPVTGSDHLPVMAKLSL